MGESVGAGVVVGSALGFTCGCGGTVKGTVVGGGGGGVDAAGSLERGLGARVTGGSGGAVVRCSLVNGDGGCPAA